MRGIIAGPTFNLTKTGPGTFIPSQNHNSYSGNTIISAGNFADRRRPHHRRHRLQSGGRPSSSTPNNITLAGGTLQGNNLNFAFCNTRGITLTADSGLSSLTNCATGIQGPITSSGNYSLTISSPGGTVGTNGVVYLEGTNTYTGNTIITSNAILSLYYSGSISNSASISIAAGAGLDVSHYTNDAGVAAFSLVSGQTLIASGTSTSTTFPGATAAVLNGAASGTVSLGSQPITLNYTPASFNGDATHPSLYVPQGALALNGNSFTVNNAAASPLGAGTYVLVQQASGSITSAGSYSVSVTGTGLASGTSPTPSISVVNGTVNLIVQNTTTTSVALTSGSNPSAYGSSLTFTATVTGGSGATPSGSVTFMDGATGIATGTLSGSGSTATATLTTNSLPVGSHSLTAVYAGDTYDVGSTSSALAQTVFVQPLSVVVAPAYDSNTGTFSASYTGTSGRCVRHLHRHQCDRPVDASGQVTADLTGLISITDTPNPPQSTLYFWIKLITNP